MNWWITQVFRYIPKWDRASILLLCGSIVLFSILAFVIGNAIKWNKRKRFSFIALGIYLTFILLSTVITRVPYEGVHLRLAPLWTFTQVKKYGWNHVLREVLFNIAMLLPLSTIVVIGFPSIKRKWIVLAGLVLSLSIELLQVALSIGVFEVDDLLFNTFGVFIGAVIGSVVNKRLEICC